MTTRENELHDLLGAVERVRAEHYSEIPAAFAREVIDAVDAGFGNEAGIVAALKALAEEHLVAGKGDGA